MYLKDIINLDVYTQSGYYLGKIIDLEIDTDTSRIVNYVVKSRNFIKNLFQNRLIISESQVISISQEKMVVEDTVKPLKEVAPVPVK